MVETPEKIECDCPCHEGKVPPHDEFLCPQCGQWLKEKAASDRLKREEDNDH